MEQLLIHIFGDYFLQTDSQTLNKKRNILVAFEHAFTYTIPFLLLTRSSVALAIICITHALLDHSNILVAFNNFKNSCNTATGFGPTRPAWITVWLTIIQDNAIHLVINYFAIKYVGHLGVIPWQKLIPIL